MILRLIHRSKFLRNWYSTKAGPKWVNSKVQMFLPYLEKGQKILDVGSGGGLVCRKLRNLGYEVIPLDIADFSYSETERPLLYDGIHIPFPDKHFDQALLLSVLHHTLKPEDLLRETARVSKNVILLEDIFRNPLQKHLTFYTDRFINWGYAPCPHTNKSDSEWKGLFDKMDMELTGFSHFRTLLFFTQAVYSLKSPQKKA